MAKPSFDILKSNVLWVTLHDLSQIQYIHYRASASLAGIT